MNQHREKAGGEAVERGHQGELLTGRRSLLSCSMELAQVIRANYLT
ncbi:hypothetical protein [Specibacter sp. NPDC078692]